MATPRDSKNDTLTVRLPARMKTAFELLSRQEDRTISTLASEILSHWMLKTHPDLIPPPDLGDSTLQGERICPVPLYDLANAPGLNALGGDKHLEKFLALTTGQVADMGADPSKLAAVRVQDNAMNPEFSEGDIAVLDTRQRKPSDNGEGIFLFRLGRDFHLLRLEAVNGGGWLGYSAHPTEKPVVIPAKTSKKNFRILGRLVMRWRQMR